MTVVPTSRLRAARDAVASSELARALSMLLEEWRAVPAAELATAIAAVDERVRIGMRAPAGATAVARQAAWTAAARTADDVGRGVLISALSETTRMADTLERIEVLASQPPDPRFAAKVGEFIERPIYNAQLPRTTAFWRRLFELLPALGDPRLVVRARGFPATWAANTELTENERDVFPRRFARIVPALEAAYGDGPPQLAAADAAICSDICALLARANDEDEAVISIARDAILEGRTTDARRILSGISEVELLAAVYAAPADDEPRHHYRRWLDSHGDVRGEFLQLQLERGPVAAMTKRERALLSEHEARWLGPLVTFVKRGATFARGFVDACALKGTHSQRMDDDPAWATVRSLEVQSSGIVQLAALTRPLRLEHLTWRIENQWEQHAFDAFDRIGVLPQLRTLGIAGRWCRAPRTRVELARFRLPPWMANVELEIASR